MRTHDECDYCGREHAHSDSRSCDGCGAPIKPRRIDAQMLTDNASLQTMQQRIAAQTHIGFDVQVRASMTATSAALDAEHEGIAMRGE